MLHATAPIVRWPRLAGPPHGRLSSCPPRRAPAAAPPARAPRGVSQGHGLLAGGDGCPVEGLGTWYGLAALWARAGLPCGLGQALARTALHGGTAPNDTSDAPQSAVGRRGGRRPRAARVAHSPQTPSQDQRPELGPPLASTGQRDGVAARCLAPAVQPSGAVALARLAHAARRRREVARTRVQTATPPQAHALARRPAVPGSGPRGRVGVLDAMQAIPRVPRGQDGGASCRLVTGAKASVGQRAGTAGPQLGPAERTWACAAAAVRCLRPQPQGQPGCARVENTPAQGQAWTRVAPQWARAVSSMGTRDTVVARDRCRNGSGRSGGAPAAARDTPGRRLTMRPCHSPPLCGRARATGPRRLALRPRGGWDPGSGSFPDGEGRRRWTWAAPLPPRSRTGVPHGGRPSCASAGMRVQRCCEGTGHPTNTRCACQRHGRRPARRGWGPHVGGPRRWQGRRHTWPETDGARPDPQRTNMGNIRS